MSPDAVILLSIATTAISLIVTAILALGNIYRPGIAIRLSVVASAGLTIIAIVIAWFALARPGQPVPADEALIGRLAILAAILVPQGSFTLAYIAGWFEREPA